MSVAELTYHQLVREAEGRARVVAIGREPGVWCFLEDYKNADGKYFRLEVQSTADGKHATAFCRYSPFGSFPDAEYDIAHVAADGFICVAAKAVREAASSPHDLRFVTLRARFWCDAYSHYKQYGEFKNP